MDEQQLEQLREQITLVIDAIIEKEGAFGMRFADKYEFEARWKCGNSIAYQRNAPFGRWTFEECLELLGAIKLYIHDENMPS